MFALFRRWLRTHVTIWHGRSQAAEVAPRKRRTSAFPVETCLKRADSAGNCIDNSGIAVWSGTRPDRTARQKTSPVKGLEVGRRAAFILPTYSGQNLCMVLPSPSLLLVCAPFHARLAQVSKGLEVRHAVHSSALLDGGYAAGHQLHRNRRGACRCRTRGAASQAVDRGPAVPTARKSQSMVAPSRRVRRSSGAIQDHDGHPRRVPADKG
jgi:hypothetical protein